MFWLTTSPGKWLTNIAASIVRVECISAYTFQNLRLSIFFLNRIKLGPTKSTLKFFFTHEKLPSKIHIFDPVYKKIRWTAIKIS